MECSFFGILSLSGWQDSPKQIFVQSFVFDSNINAIVFAVISHVDILVLLHILDSVDLSFLLKSESLVGRQTVSSAFRNCKSTERVINPPGFNILLIKLCSKKGIFSDNLRL